MFKVVPALLFAAFLATTSPALGQSTAEFGLYDDELHSCSRLDLPEPSQIAPEPERPHPDLLARILRYTGLAGRHRVKGLASYYSTFFEGRKTANGEIYRNQRYSAAHLTLPLGCWIEVKSRATGRTLRLRVNDRGPYAKKFALDLSQAAARYLGVDTSRDRYVEIRIIAMPGEEPLPESLDWAAAANAGTSDETSALAGR
ncbi:MAG: septal ring lytic transglycosylase RlpA family protein [Thermoanaerobaculia bacterium]